MVAEYLSFIKELPRSFSEIGAMLPSSPALAKLMVKPIVKTARPLRILEVGPGTGPFTRAVLERMNEHDSFTICEINQRFMTRLIASLQNNPDYIRNIAQVTFYQGSVQEFSRSIYGEKFDVVISSLPFLNFQPEAVDELFELLSGLCTDHGTLSFFHYWGLSALAHLLPNAEVKRRVRAVENVIDNWRDRVRSDGQVTKKASFFNFPPAIAEEFHFHRTAKIQ